MKWEDGQGYSWRGFKELDTTEWLAYTNTKTQSNFTRFHIQNCFIIFGSIGYIFSCFQLFVTPWTVAQQASLSMSYPLQVYWSGLPLPSPGELPIPGIKPAPPIFQFSSATQSCPTLCDPMNCSTPGFPVHHQLPDPTQTHVHWVSDAIQPSHPLSSPSPPAFNLC